MNEDDQHGAVWSLDLSLVRVVVVVVLVVDGQKLVNCGSVSSERVIGNEEKVIYKRVLKKAKSKRKCQLVSQVVKWSTGQVVWLLGMNELLPFNVLGPEVPVVVIGDDDRIVVQSGFQDEPVIVGQHKLVVDKSRRRVSQVALLFQIVENLRIESWTLSVRTSTSEAWY